MEANKVAIISTLVLWGCTPRVDGSSNESAKSTIAQVTESIPSDRQEEFAQAVMTVAMKDVKSLADMANIDQASMLKNLDGMSAEEIFAEYASIMAERKQQQLKQSAQEILELETKKKKSEESIAKLNSFEVKRSRFYKKQQRYGSPKPIIEIMVKNGTGSPVARAHFTGIVATPGRV